MPASLTSIQELVNLHSPRKIKDTIGISESVQKLLEGIQVKVEIFIKDRNISCGQEIIRDMDTLKGLLGDLSDQALREILQGIQKGDGKRWRNYIWERVDTSDQGWNENNQNDRFTVRGISVDDIIAISRNRQKLYQEKPIITIILTIAGVYGLTHELIREIHNKKR